MRVRALKGGGCALKIGFAPLKIGGCALKPRGFAVKMGVVPEKGGLELRNEDLSAKKGGLGLTPGISRSGRPRYRPGSCSNTGMLLAPKALEITRSGEAGELITR